MAVVYFYTPKFDTEKFLKNGFKLSLNYTKELNLNGYLTKCIGALLNPKDDIEKFDGEEYDCLKLDVDISYCKVIDLSKIFDGLGPKLFDLDKYTFGTFKEPEVLITISIPCENISILNKDIDIPVLFENSKELYFELQNLKIISEMTSEEIYNKLIKEK